MGVNMLPEGRITYRLRIFENSVMRRIFGSKSEEVKGGWRMLHTKEVHNLHSSPNTVRTT
jgi:hypothetical protein